MNVIDKLKNSWKSWTIWFNGLMTTIVVALPSVQDAFPQIQSYLPANIYKYAMGALVAGNILLRFKTNKSLADK